MCAVQDLVPVDTKKKEWRYFDEGVLDALLDRAALPVVDRVGRAGRLGTLDGRLRVLQQLLRALPTFQRERG